MRLFKRVALSRPSLPSPLPSGEAAHDEHIVGGRRQKMPLPAATAPELPRCAGQADESGRPIHFAVLLVAMLSTSTATAQIQLDRFYPPVVAIGAEATLKAEGKFPVWPVEIVCDRDDVKIDAGKASGEVKIVVPAEAAPGVAWVRMHDKTSASKLVPILIEPIKPLAETEPNNDVAAAGKIDLPNVLVGRLEKSGDVDSFRIAVRAGQTLVISTTAHQVLRSPMDAVLQLVDLQGNVLVQADDVRGIDPQIVYDVQDDGELLVRIFAFPETPNSTIGFAGNASFVYVLRITTDLFVDHVLPLVLGSDTPVKAVPLGWNLPPQRDVKHHAATSTSPAVAYVPGSLGWQWQTAAANDAANVTESNAAEEPTDAEKLPFIFSGHIGQPGEIDRVRVKLQKGKKYRASVQSREFGFAIDSVLRFVDTNGTELAHNDDRSRNQYDAAIDYSAKEDGEVELQISDLVEGFGPRHAYSLLIEESKPSVALTLTEDHYAVKAGESVEIAVAVSRLQGFNAKVRVAAEGLPAGVESEAIDSEIKGDSAKSVKLKLTAKQDAAVYQGTFKVVGHVLDDQGNATGESATAFYQLRELIPLSNVWLTVSPVKP